MKLVLSNATQTTELQNMKSYLKDLDQVASEYKAGKITDKDKKSEAQKISERYTKNESAMERIIDQWENEIKEFEKIKNEFSKNYRKLVF